MVEIIESLGSEAFTEMFADSPKLVAMLDAIFSGPERADLRCLLLESADESPYSLRQWVDSLRIVRAWLDARHLEMSTEDQLGYICCAGESAGAGANLTHLPALVTDMLEAYGCERAVKKGC